MSERTPSAEPPAGSSEPVSVAPRGSSVAVSEQIAARRLGVSLDMLRRDRRTGKLGIPFIKLGVGKRGLVRYDLADLERWVEAKKRIGRPPVVQVRPAVDEPTARQPEHPVELQAPEPRVDEPTVPLMPARPRTMWDALAEHACGDDPPADPFAAAGRTTPRRQGSGYWGH
jgi:hypothetical protein